MSIPSDSTAAFARAGSALVAGLRRRALARSDEAGALVGRAVAWLAESRSLRPRARVARRPWGARRMRKPGDPGGRHREGGPLANRGAKRGRCVPVGGRQRRSRRHARVLRAALVVSPSGASGGGVDCAQRVEPTAPRTSHGTPSHAHGARSVGARVRGARWVDHHRLSLRGGSSAQRPRHPGAAGPGHGGARPVRDPAGSCGTRGSRRDARRVHDRANRADSVLGRGARGQGPRAPLCQGLRIRRP